MDLRLNSPCFPYRLFTYSKHRWYYVTFRKCMKKEIDSGPSCWQMTCIGISLKIFPNPKHIHNSDIFNHLKWYLGRTTMLFSAMMRFVLPSLYSAGCCKCNIILVPSSSFWLGGIRQSHCFLDLITLWGEELVPNTNNKICNFSLRKFEKFDWVW